MMWQRFTEAVESKGGRVDLNTGVVRLEREGHHIKRVIVQREVRVAITRQHKEAISNKIANV